MAIFGYFAAQIFDSIAHRVMGRAWREKKRRAMIDELRDHIIVCGFGRVGRRAGEGGDLELRPTKETLLEESDGIVGIGSPSEIKLLEELFEPQERRA